MARSYRKPYCTEGYRRKHRRKQKRLANRKVRRVPLHRDIPGGSAYRKYFCSWNICDWRWPVRAPYPKDLEYQTTRIRVLVNWRTGEQVHRVASVSDFKWD